MVRGGGGGAALLLRRRRGEEGCWFDVLEGGCLGIYIGEGRVLLGVGDKN